MNKELKKRVKSLVGCQYDGNVLILKNLKLFPNDIDTLHFIIKLSPNLTILQLEGCYVKDDEFYRLFQALNITDGMRKLLIRSNLLTLKTVQRLVSSSHSILNQLDELDLRGNNIGEEG